MKVLRPSESYQKNIELTIDVLNQEIVGHEERSQSLEKELRPKRRKIKNR